MVDVYPLVSLDAFINHAAAASPARAKSPGIMPAQPLRDRNLEDRSIMDLMWARSSEYWFCVILQSTLYYKVITLF